MAAVSGELDLALEFDILRRSRERDKDTGQQQQAPNQPVMSESKHRQNSIPMERLTWLVTLALLKTGNVRKRLNSAESNKSDRGRKIRLPSAPRLRPRISPKLLASVAKPRTLLAKALSCAKTPFSSSLGVSWNLSWVHPPAESSPRIVVNGLNGSPPKRTGWPMAA